MHFQTLVRTKLTQPCLDWRNKEQCRFFKTNQEKLEGQTNITKYEYICTLPQILTHMERLCVCWERWKTILLCMRVYTSLVLTFQFCLMIFNLVHNDKNMTLSLKCTINLFCWDMRVFHKGNLKANYYLSKKNNHMTKYYNCI